MAGTGTIVYHREEKILETKHKLGTNITKVAAEYISVIIGLQEIRNSFRCLRNKIIVINIKSQMVVN